LEIGSIACISKLLKFSLHTSWSTPWQFVSQHFDLPSNFVQHRLLADHRDLGRRAKLEWRGELYGFEAQVTSYLYEESELKHCT
jgi:hypothetical protein